MVVDDSREFTITLAVVEKYPKASIVSVDYPTTPVSAGADVSVTFTLKNIGEATGVIYAELKDKDTGEIVGSRAQQSVAVGGTFSAKWTVTMPSKNWNLRLEAGH